MRDVQSSICRQAKASFVLFEERLEFFDILRMQLADLLVRWIRVLLDRNRATD